MKNKIITITLVVGSALTVNGQQFDATAINLQTGQVSTIVGNINGGFINNCSPIKPKPSTVEIYQEIADRARAQKLKTQASTDQAWSEMATSRIEYELRQQTELLRKISNK